MKEPTLYDPRTDAAIPLGRAVLCLSCETIRHAEMAGGRCPCGSDADAHLGRWVQSLGYCETASELGVSAENLP